MTAVISFVVVAFGTLMTLRLFFLGVPGGAIFPMPIIVTLLGLGFTIGWFFSLRRSSLMSTPEHRNSRNRIIKSEISHMWPLLLFVVVLVGYTIFSTIVDQLENPDMRHTIVWGINNIMYCLPLLAGYIIGRANRRLETQTITYFVAALMGVSLLFALGEYLQVAGYDNFIGTFLYKWSMNMRAHGGVVAIFEQGNLSFRASGLETYPFRLAFPAVMAAAWATSAKGTPLARIFIHACVVAILLVSGSRAALIAYIAVLGVSSSIWLLNKLTNRLGLTRAGGTIALAIVSLLIVGVLGIGYALIPAPQPGANNNSALTRVIESLAFFKYELTHSQLDSQDLDVLGSGRWVRWERSVDILKEHPLGSGQPHRGNAGSLRSHNDMLGALVWGGPFMLIALLLFYWWIAFRTKTPGAPNFGLYLAVGIVVAGLTEAAVVGAPHLFFGLFLLGAARRDVDRSGEHHFSWDTIK